jgi:uncharacterized protein YbcI
VEISPDSREIDGFTNNLSVLLLQSLNSVNVKTLLSTRLEMVRCRLHLEDDFLMIRDLVGNKFGEIFSHLHLRTNLIGYSGP